MSTVIVRIKNCDPRRLLSFITARSLARPPRPSLRDATYKIKIEPRPLRVLTIPGRLSSDLQPIVIPAFPVALPFSNRPLFPPILFSLLHSLTLSLSPSSPPPLSLFFLFLNPHRFRPCRVEFESTAQNRGVTKASYVSRRHAAMEGCAPFLNPGNESRPAQERATRAEKRFFRPTSRGKMLPSSTGTRVRACEQDGRKR